MNSDSPSNDSFALLRSQGDLNPHRHLVLLSQLQKSFCVNPSKAGIQSFEYFLANGFRRRRHAFPGT
jgi:hypothetical protein